jgi:tetratricopeptide (TPR) repeat protein
MQALMKESRKQLFIGIVIAVLLIIAGLVKGVSSKALTPRAVSAVPQDSMNATKDQPQSTAAFLQEKRKEEREAKAKTAIAENLKAIASDYRGKETPDRLMAVGNLYQYQLGDYYSATEYYQDLIDNFPNRDSVAQAYVELATCYEKLGDEIQSRYVLQEMVDKLDPSLEHVKYAKRKLGES